ncbi:Nucleoside diphosphate kinase [Diplonema papillatum]|nr:Nucleoside diphosphate kinase [Diplonema papillatum]
MQGQRTERTFVAVKPDGVQRCLVGEVIKRFEQKGFKLVGMKMIHPSYEQAELHYKDLANKPFFHSLCEYFTSGPVVAMVWEGCGVVEGIRRLLGSSKPGDAQAGSVRGDLCVDVMRNVAHTSDSVEAGVREVDLWFQPFELVSWKKASDDWLYDT